MSRFRLFWLAFALLICALFVGALSSCTAISCLVSHRHSGIYEPPDPNPPRSIKTFHVGKEDVPVWRYGDHGPPVLLLHELPGMTRACIRLAQLIAARGYRVYVPKLFGGYGESDAGIGRSIHICRNGEFDCRSDDNPDAPLLPFIQKDLFPLMKEKPDDKTVVIGMCLTGNVSAALLGDDFVAGAIMSQPAMPLPFTARKRMSVGLNGGQIESARNSGKPLLAFRFTNDCLSPPERMESFERIFGSRITVLQIDSGPCNHAGLPTTAHAVLTQFLRTSEPDHPTNRALQMTFDFLDAHLRAKRD